MLLVFTLLGLVIIGFVTYGFAVVNKMPTKMEGPTWEDEVNQLTSKFNTKVSNLKANYLKSEVLCEEDKAAVKALKADVTNTYNGLRKEYEEEVKQVTAPKAQANPVRAFWNKVLYGGLVASLTCCFGSGIYAVSGEEEAPKKAVKETAAWNGDNIPMPHLEDASQYVANPDKVLSRTTVDSMNVMLQKLDEELGVETAIAVINYCEGGEAFRLAQDMGNKYGVGRNDRGLVVVMAYGDHDINISPGTGLESTLSDGKCGRLLDDYAVPFLKKELPDSAMLYLTRALLEVLRDQDELSPVYQKPQSEEEHDLGIVGMGTLGLLGALGLVRRRLNKKGLLEENITPLMTAMPNPTIELPKFVGTGSTYGSSRDRDDDRRYRSRSSSSSRPSRGSYGGGHFGGGGASRKW